MNDCFYDKALNLFHLVPQWFLIAWGVWWVFIFYHRLLTKFFFPLCTFSKLQSDHLSDSWNQSHISLPIAADSSNRPSSFCLFLSPLLLTASLIAFYFLASSAATSTPLQYLSLLLLSSLCCVLSWRKKCHFCANFMNRPFLHWGNIW